VDLRPDQHRICGSYRLKRFLAREGEGR
jgi:hypothetical protein